MLDIDIPFMIAVAVACLPIFVTGNLVARWEGIVFLAYYVAYIIYLFFTATQHDSLAQFQSVHVLVCDSTDAADPGYHDRAGDAVPADWPYSVTGHRRGRHL